MYEGVEERGIMGGGRSNNDVGINDTPNNNGKSNSNGHISHYRSNHKTSMTHNNINKDGDWNGGSILSALSFQNSYYTASENSSLCRDNSDPQQQQQQQQRQQQQTATAEETMLTVKRSNHNIHHKEKNIRTNDIPLHYLSGEEEGYNTCNEYKEKENKKPNNNDTATGLILDPLNSALFGISFLPFSSSFQQHQQRLSRCTHQVVTAKTTTRKHRNNFKVKTHNHNNVVASNNNRKKNDNNHHLISDSTLSVIHSQGSKANNNLHGGGNCYFVMSEEEEDESSIGLFSAGEKERLRRKKKKRRYLPTIKKIRKGWNKQRKNHHKDDNYNPPNHPNNVNDNDEDNNKLEEEHSFLTNVSIPKIVSNKSMNKNVTSPSRDHPNNNKNAMPTIDSFLSLPDLGTTATSTMINQSHPSSSTNNDTSTATDSLPLIVEQLKLKSLNLKREADDATLRLQKLISQIATLELQMQSLQNQHQQQQQQQQQQLQIPPAPTQRDRLPTEGDDTITSYATATNNHTITTTSELETVDDSPTLIHTEFSSSEMTLKSSSHKRMASSNSPESQEEEHNITTKQKPPSSLPPRPQPPRRLSSFLRINDLLLSSSASSSPNNIDNYDKNNCSIATTDDVLSSCTREEDSKSSLSISQGRSRSDLFSMDRLNHRQNVLDALCNIGLKYATDEGPRWSPDKPTEQHLKLSSSLWQSPLSSKHIYVWSGKLDSSPAEKVPVIKARALIPGATPQQLLDLLLDSSRVKEYNKMSLGRTDKVTYSSPTTTTSSDDKEVSKVIHSLSKPPIIRKHIELLSLIHARKLQKELHDGHSGYILVSRSVWEDESQVPDNYNNPSKSTTKPFSNSNNNCIRSEVLLGVNLIRDTGTPNISELTTITHINTPGLPTFGAKKIAMAAATNFLRDIQSIFSNNLI